MENINKANGSANILFIEGSDEYIESRVKYNAERFYKYNQKIYQIILTQLEKELKYIKETGIAIVFIVAEKLIDYSEEKAYRYKKEFTTTTKINVDAPLVAYFMGITQECPLPLHYLCWRCCYSDFDIKDEMQSDNESPKKLCPNCNEVLETKGVVDYKFIQPIDINNQKLIELSFSNDIKQEIIHYRDVLAGEENRHRTGVEITFHQ